MLIYRSELIALVNVCKDLKHRLYSYLILNLFFPGNKENLGKVLSSDKERRETTSLLNYCETICYI